MVEVVVGGVVGEELPPPMVLTVVVIVDVKATSLLRATVMIEYISA